MVERGTVLGARVIAMVSQVTSSAERGPQPCDVFVNNIEGLAEYAAIVGR